MKIKSIIYRDNLNNRVTLLLWNLIHRKYFKSYGKNNRFGKPYLLINPEYISIGNNVTIRSGIRLEPITKWNGRNFKPYIAINDGVIIEQNCHIVSAKSLIIEKNVLISSNVFISDLEHNYRDLNKPIYKNNLIVKQVKIGEETFIGTGAKILAGVTIGKHCVIGANCVVTKDIPDYSVVAGVPGKIIKVFDTNKKMWINKL